MRRQAGRRSILRMIWVLAMIAVLGAAGRVSAGPTCQVNCANLLRTCTSIHPGPPLAECQSLYEQCLAHCS